MSRGIYHAHADRLPILWTAKALRAWHQNNGLAEPTSRTVRALIVVDIGPTEGLLYGSGRLIADYLQGSHNKGVTTRLRRDYQAQRLEKLEDPQAGGNDDDRHAKDIS